jgi:predicted O-methyltransferase YrrM
MSRSSFLFYPELARYYDSVGCRETPLLAHLREETDTLPEARMQIAPEQGQFMAMLVRLMGARHCIEVGVFTGYSTLVVAQAMPPEGRLLACDLSEEWTAIAQRYWQRAGVADRIDLRLAPAAHTLQAELLAGGEGRFDFAFIDADKTGYLGYYEQCLQLLRPGGLIAVDNTLWSGRVADPEISDGDTVALRKFNRFVADDERVDHCLLPIADGLTLCQKRR